MPKELQLCAVAPGEVISMEKVPDSVFSQKMMGDGFAIIPPSSGQFTVVAPCSGVLTRVFHSGHAFVIKHEGIDIIVHIGLDTVKLQGAGFRRLRMEGETVTAGTPVIHVDADRMKYAGKNLVTPVVIMAPLSNLELTCGDTPSGEIVCTATL